MLPSPPTCCCWRWMQSIAEYYRVLQSITEYCRVLQSIAECYRVLQSIGSGGCCHHLLPAAAGGGCLLIAQPCQPTRGGARCCSGSSRAFRYSARERVAQVQGRSCTLQQPPILTSQQSQIAENRRAGEPNLVTLIIQLTCRPAGLCSEPARLQKSAEYWLLLQD